MMCSPAALHARQLQQQALQQELQLVQAQQQRLELQAQCSSYEAQLVFDKAAGQVSLTLVVPMPLVTHHYTRFQRIRCAKATSQSRCRLGHHQTNPAA
jgi:multidrug resistance efflux pump